MTGEIEPIKAKALNSKEPPEWSVGYVYLLNTSDRYQKIGFSTNPVARAESFSRLPFCVWLEHAFPVGSASIERAIHSRFNAKRIRGEWFILNQEEIAFIKTVSGAKSRNDLPVELQVDGANRPRIQIGTVDLPKSQKGGRPNIPWYRKSRGKWFVTIRDSQVCLGITDPNDFQGAVEKFKAILGEQKA